MLRSMHRAPLRSKPRIACSDYVNSSGVRPPPSLLPAPGAASFVVPAGLHLATHIGRLSHLAAQLAGPSAEKAVDITAATQQSTSGHRDQLDTLVRSHSSESAAAISK